MILETPAAVMSTPCPVTEPSPTTPGRSSPRILDLPNIGDERGFLLVAEQFAHVPFDIKRLFVLHRLPEDAQRAHHAHRRQHQLLIMLAGRCEAMVDNGEARTTLTLDRPDKALYLPPMLWLELSDFSAGSICAVLSSGEYDETDYVRERAEFEALAGQAPSRPAICR